MRAGIGDGQHAATRLPADENARRCNVGAANQRGYGCSDVTQRSICTSQRYVRIARISLRSLRREALIVSPVRFAAPATLREGHGPAALVQEVRQTDIEPRRGEQGRI